MSQSRANETQIIWGRDRHHHHQNVTTQYRSAKHAITCIWEKIKKTHSSFFSFSLSSPLISGWLWFCDAWLLVGDFIVCLCSIQFRPCLFILLGRSLFCCFTWLHVSPQWKLCSSQRAETCVYERKSIESFIWWLNIIFSLNKFMLWRAEKIYECSILIVVGACSLSISCVLCLAGKRDSHTGYIYWDWWDRERESETERINNDDNYEQRHETQDLGQQLALSLASSPSSPTTRRLST